MALAMKFNTLQGEGIKGNAAYDAWCIRVTAPQLTLNTLFFNIRLLLRWLTANELLSDMTARP
jgi:hypothetical protein